MPDGLEVKMDYYKQVSIEGTLITPKDGAKELTKVTTPSQSKNFRKIAFNTNDIDYISHARNGFVNMIQASDALVARLIVVHLHRLGVKHIVSIHDCFRVNIHDVKLLEQAIINAYMDLFGTDTNTKTLDMPMGTDIIALYLKGSKEATSEMWVDQAPKGSQFFGKDQIRRLAHVNGEKFASLIQQLGFTYYFAK